VFYSEGDLHVAIDVATDGDVGHAVVLAVLNTREVTVPATVWAIIFVVRCAADPTLNLRIVLWLYGLFATATAALVGAKLSVPLLLTVFDVTGVVVGGHIMSRFGYNGDGTKSVTR
jgi:hypothetical protein